MAAYQPIQMPGGSGDFGDAFDRILRARQVSQQAEAQRAEMLLKQQQLTQNQQLQAAQIQDYQSKEASRTAAEAEQKRLATRQEHLDIANAIPKIKSMLTPGSPDFDPEAGMSLARVHNVNLAAVAPQMPEAPAKRDIGPTQVEYGPQISPEDAQQSAILGAKTSPDQPDARADEVMRLGDAAEAERARFEQANNPATVATNARAKVAQEAEQGDYATRLAAAQKRQPTYSGTSPVGPVTIDPNAIIAAREAERRRQQDQLSPLAGAVDADFQPVVEAMVKANMPASEIAKAVSDYRKQAATEASKKEYSLTAADQKRHQLAMEAAAREGNRVRATQVTEHAPSATEAENAARGRNMTLALKGLQDSGMADYVPPPAVTQKWLSNQDQIEAAGTRNKGTVGQGVNWLMRKGDAIPANEFDGLSEKDKQYFTLVRQYVEPYARKQSGAAISANEWQNFLSQIGPQAGAPGSRLAHQAAEDMVTLGGRATRKLEKADESRRPKSRDDERATTLKNGGKPAKSIDDLVREAGGG